MEVTTVCFSLLWHELCVCWCVCLGWCKTYKTGSASKRMCLTVLKVHIPRNIHVEFRLMLLKLQKFY